MTTTATVATPDAKSLATAAFYAAVRMANLSHNLAQRDTPPTADEWQQYRRMMRENQTAWDAGEAAVRDLVSDAGAGEGKITGVSPNNPTPVPKNPTNSASRDA